MLQNYNEYLPTPLSSTARHMGKWLVSFANGQNEQPGADSCVVWGPAGKQEVMRTGNYDRSMRAGSASLLESIGIEKCIRALEYFQFGRLV
jgi:hypothetical protein